MLLDALRHEEIIFFSRTVNSSRAEDDIREVVADALNAVVQLMEADPSRLKHRNSFNIAAMSFEPGQIAAEIRKHLPDFKMDYQIDPVKQAIADSWPNSMDDSCAREEWGWKPEYNLQNMTVDMLVKVKEKFDKGLIK